MVSSGTTNGESLAAIRAREWDRQKRRQIVSDSARSRVINRRRNEPFSGANRG